MAGNKGEFKAPAPIPEGWVVETMLKEDGTKVQCFLCPETEQRFSTYNDLMRYVAYAKKAKLSIYDPNFKSNMKKEKGSVPFKKEGQSSNPLANIKIRKDIMAKTEGKDHN